LERTSGARYARAEVPLEMPRRKRENPSGSGGPDLKGILHCISVPKIHTEIAKDTQDPKKIRTALVIPPDPRAQHWIQDRVNTRAGIT